MKKTSIHIIGIVGLGLIGTSLGMALKRKNATLRIKGFTRSRINGKHALAQGAIDSIHMTIDELIDATDLVILATPIRSSITILEHIGACTRLPILVTDTGSTKVTICNASRNLPEHVFFIGGHPLTGKEVSGAMHAEATLFTGRPWVLTPIEKGNLRQRAALRSLLTQIGAVVLEMTPKDHDRIVVPVSHLPFVISALLMETAQTHRDWTRAQTLAGNGFRDATRLSAGNPTMHTDILRTNRSAILSELTRFEKTVHDLKQEICAEHWAAIEKRLGTIQKTRLDWERRRV